MPDLPTYKRFPGPTGGDTSPRVKVSTPIPRRAEPLAGLKKMDFPKGKGDDILPNLYQFRGVEAKDGPWWQWKNTKHVLLRSRLVSFGVIIFLTASAILFSILTAY